MEVSMNLNIIYLLVAAIAIYFFFFTSQSKEGFETNQRVVLKTVDGKYAKICADKHLCASNNESERVQFSIMKFSDDLIALSNGGYYVASCFGETCKDDMIKVNSFNPYAPNAKLALEKENDYYYVKFYDEKYLSLDSNDHFIKTSDKSGSIKVQFV
jgi:hypothetical protein